MPPRKKRRQTSRKAQLQFHQQPLEGPKHQYGSPQLPITHTRQVLPQFDTTADSWFLSNRRWKRHHQDQSRRSSRKTTTSKFAHLTFESPQPSSSPTTLGSPLIQECPNHSEKDISRRALVPMLSPQSCEELSAHALQNLPYIFIAPDIQTPESSSVKQLPAPPDQGESSLPGCSRHTSTPESPEPGAVLVEDTPEEKYGVKVTWRRRQRLFTYLRERGKLNKSQFLVKN
ncbi:RAD9-HUS1-RAD1 interacting nuclear orphan 1 [Phyllostomus discolor]|uniref:RAD9, HUS1, RAD1-interacting nuclear orphan protein 1 isoform X2 n=1 Tax=Phyllostomus discolor TaxID=89673 RepID=A0A6J2N740_9CHIR|nr:RAD9, HUS1, RAD1-interacting nuclear orphan protein 1 isoform X2 [Phyllostomus discolor]KAF6121451.1 RAD9-HUS1-RAD1 interacting nuclear orphan 1 [Phyllostomus discolor]